MRKEVKREPLGRCCECGQAVYYSDSPKAQISCAQDVCGMFEALKNRRTEVFRVLVMNSQSQILHIEDIAQGCSNLVHVSLAEVFRVPILYSASTIICVHNHPSGRVDPSLNDKVLTDSIVKVGQLLGIKLLDHVIITKEGYYSFAEQGILHQKEWSTLIT